MRRTGFAIDKQSNRYAPSALPGNTPVRTILEHPFNARLAPLRQPLHLVNGFYCTLVQTGGVHADKPLRGGTENQWGFMTPAMRVAVLDFLMSDQPISFFQRFDNRLIRLAYMHATNDTKVSNKQTVILHRIKYVDAILLGDNKVILTMTRRGMHATSTGVSGDMLAENNRHFTLIERVIKQQPF